MTITSVNVVNNAEQCQVFIIIDSPVGTPEIIVLIDGRVYVATLT
jgi:hypothetical protein